MNREILFRAKKVDDGEWVEGYVVQKYGTHFLYDVKNADTCRQNSYLVDPNTICQYTGLTDKNGKKIWENDILKGFFYPYCHDGEYNYYAQIEWSEYTKAFVIVTVKNPKSSVRGISDGNTELMEGWEPDSWEIIGNIYDNPELLEDKKDETI